MERPDLADELEQLASHDLVVRQRLLDAGELMGGYHPDMRAVHRHNGDRLTEIIDELGRWPGQRLVGAAGARAAHLIAQHDIENHELMRRAHELYGAAVEGGDAEPAGLAYLEDRIRAFEGQRQRYGTQVGWNLDGEFGPWPPIDDAASVDDRRASIGLPPLADAIELTAAGRRRRRPVNEVLSEHDDFERFAIRTGWRGGKTQRP